VTNTGTKNLHLVFSSPPSGVSDAVYNAWYDAHLGEILATPGFEAARRYVLTPQVGTREPATKRFLSLYEIGDDVAAVMKNLGGERPNMDLPEWFDGIAFASWNCVLRPGYDSPVAADRLYLVFSSEPDGVTDHEYDDWYQQHLAENLAVAGFERGWRFRTTGENVPDPTVEPVTHLGLYELADSMAALRSGLTAARDSGSVYFPDWFDRIDFASLEASALGERITA
jgi:hypothetical protein